MASFLESLQEKFSPEVVQQIGAKLGVDSATTSKAVDISLPLLTAGMANAASTSEGLARLTEVLAQADANVVDNVPGAIADADPVADRTTLNSIFGSTLPNVTASVRRASGIDIGPMLALLAPIVAGALSRFARDRGLSAYGISNLLGSEATSFANSGSPVAGIVSSAVAQMDVVTQASANANPLTLGNPASTVITQPTHTTTTSTSLSQPVTSGLGMNTRSLFVSSGLAGLAMAALSNLPVIEMGNCLACMWLWVGGIVGAALYRRSEGSITPGQGIVVGLVGGLIGAVLGAVFSTIRGTAGLTSGLTAIGADPFGAFAGSGVTAGSFSLLGLLFNAFIYPLFGAIGGGIGAVIFGSKSRPPA